MSRTTRPRIVVPIAGRVGVDQGGDAEAAAGEPGVAGERLAQVADADQRDRAVHGDAQRARDLLGQGRHVVADAADAVGAEVGQVLAQLGRVHAGRAASSSDETVVIAAVAERRRARADRSPAGRRSRPVRGRRTGHRRRVTRCARWTSAPRCGPAADANRRLLSAPANRCGRSFADASDGTPLVNLFPNRAGPCYRRLRLSGLSARSRRRKRFSSTRQ